MNKSGDVIGKTRFDFIPVENFPVVWSLERGALGDRDLLASLSHDALTLGEVSENSPGTR
ncbi:MAG: hypothetical protein ACI89E_000125 [Planctomycetota bacterium]|jgi:hypothetical protein